MSSYQGYANYATWKVITHITHTEPLYRAAVTYANSKGPKTWRGFVRYAGLNKTKTLDGIPYNSKLLNHKELIEHIKDLASD